MSLFSCSVPSDSSLGFFSCENSSYSPLLFLDYYGIMCHRWVAEVGTLETKNRKDTMMTESYENWESGIDWSRRTAVVGGPAFYDFVKAKALPALEDGLRQLEATKASCEERMRRWGGIAERADKLSASFVGRRRYSLAKGYGRFPIGCESARSSPMRCATGRACRRSTHRSLRT